MKTICLITGAAFLVVALSSTAVCRHNDEEASTTTTTGAQMRVSNDEAVMRLTNARCAREIECEHVGLERRFVDRDACARELGRDAQTTFGIEACPFGIDDGQLTACAADARDARCTPLVDPTDAIDRLFSCRRTAVCMTK